MKKSKRYFMIIGILLLIIFLFFLYPKSGSFDNLIIKTIEKESITRIIVADSDKQIQIDDTEQIYEVISKLSKLKITEYKKEIPHDTIISYTILFKNEASFKDYFAIFIYDTGYVKVYIPDNPSYSKDRTYKINNDLDIEYIKRLLS